jgi:uncharacterized membrane protein YbhN (UPF0104 family)
MTQRTRTSLLFWGRVLLSVLILALLLRGLDAKRVVAGLLTVDIASLLGAVAILAIQPLFMNLRWVLILKAAGGAIRKGPALRILLISFWFNQALPSSLGGDVVRIWLLRRRGMGWGPAVRGVLADRLTALLGLIVLIAVGFPLLLTRVNEPLAHLAIGGLAAAGVVGILVLVTLDRWPARLVSIQPLRSLAKLGSLTRFLLLQYKHRGKVLGLAILIHLMTTATCLVLARGIRVELSVLDAFILIPPVILLSALPISISGWGVREGGMVAMLSLVGISAEDALTISVLLGLAAAVVGLIGGVLWVTGPERQKFSGEEMEKVAAESVAASEDLALFDDAVESREARS